ncbi:MAG: peptide deformylase [Akkermansia sp.]
MLLEVIQYGHPTLRQKSRLVESVNEDLLTLAKNMLETMYAADGVGLAAPQVNVPIQLVIIDIPTDEESVQFLQVDGVDKTLADIMPLTFINPVLEPYGSMVAFHEGCLSVRKIRASVTRPSCVKATVTLLDGSTVMINCDGLLARCFQHECDHLNGVLFVERVSSAQRITLRNRLKRLTER